LNQSSHLTACAVGNDTNSTPEPIKHLLGAVTSHTGGLPIRLRLGGNSMDSSTYVADQSNILTFTNPDANFNDQPVDFGPVLWVSAPALTVRTREGSGTKPCCLL
jgi:hypothetical protein